MPGDKRDDDSQGAEFDYCGGMYCQLISSNLAARCILTEGVFDLLGNIGCETYQCDLL